MCTVKTNLKKWEAFLLTIVYFATNNFMCLIEDGMSACIELTLALIEQFLDKTNSMLKFAVTVTANEESAML